MLVLLPPPPIPSAADVVVPEPASMMLLGTGLLSLLGARHFRRKFRKS
jgi:hypothetical protein